MQTLRNAHQLARFVLVWFALALGVAAASPLVRTEGQQLVCTAMAGVKLVNVDDGGEPRAGTGLQDCPLCVLAGAPPRQLQLTVALPVPAAALMPVMLRTSDAARTAPPLPPRGPPEVS